MSQTINCQEFGKNLLSIVSVVILTFSLFIKPEHVIAEQLPIIRDVETERLLKDYARPILRVANLTEDSLQPILVNKRTFYPFISYNTHILINLDVIKKAKTPNEIIGILAHEIAHIQENHFARIQETESKDPLIDLISRHAFAFNNSEELIADRLALTFLHQTNQSAKGLLTVFKRLKNTTLESSVNPFLLTHPIPPGRISQIEEIAKRSKYFDTIDSENFQRRHNLVRAKLIGFTTKPSDIIYWYPNSDKSVAANYARAVAKMRSGNIDGAIKTIDTLISFQPKNPYFWELKGQTLIEAGRVKQSIAPFKKALSLAPEEGQFQIWYGYALVASEDKKNLDEAIRNLTQGLEKDSNSPLGYRQLAIAKERLGLIAEADLATAQGHMATGNYVVAKQFAFRAQSKFEEGSRKWTQANDIVTYQSQ